MHAKLTCCTEYNVSQKRPTFLFATPVTCLHQLISFFLPANFYAC